MCLFCAILRAAIQLHLLLLHTKSCVRYKQFGTRSIKVPTDQGEVMLRGSLGLSQSGDARIVRALFSWSSVSCSGRNAGDRCFSHLPLNCSELFTVLSNVLSGDSSRTESRCTFCMCPSFLFKVGAQTQVFQI